MDAISRFEQWVGDAVPKSSWERHHWQGGDFLVPMDVLPSDVQRFYAAVRSHCLLPHYGSCQDSLLLPSSDVCMTEGLVDDEPIYILSEFVESWQMSVMHNADCGWRLFRTGASHENDWKEVHYPIIDTLICFTLSEVVFHSTLTMSRDHRLAPQLKNPNECGGMYYEDAVKCLDDSKSDPEMIFAFPDLYLFPSFNRDGDRIPTEFWYDSDTRFLWCGPAFGEAGKATKLPLQRSLIDETTPIAEQSAAGKG